MVHGNLWGYGVGSHISICEFIFMYEALQPNWCVYASNNSNKHTPFSKHCHNIRVAYTWMYSSGPSNGNTNTFLVGGGGKFCYACITH
jgi:hypothetical protein